MHQSKPYFDIVLQVFDMQMAEIILQNIKSEFAGWLERWDSPNMCKCTFIFLMVDLRAVRLFVKLTEAKFAKELLISFLKVKHDLPCIYIQLDGNATI